MARYGLFVLKVPLNPNQPTNLLIGHTHLTHSYLLNKEQPPNSNYCKSLLTVEHILTSCSAYKNIGEKHYPNSQLPHILTNISKHHIFNYLSEINFFNKL